jgi:alkyl sulfatase BDS1-like metallo-beta-lactamase superfamily hydrolase
MVARLNCLGDLETLMMTDRQRPVAVFDADPGRRRVLLAGSAAAATPLLAMAPSSHAQLRAQSAAAKPPSEFTKAANRGVLKALPFNDRSDFEAAQRGFIAGLPGSAGTPTQDPSVASSADLTSNLPLDMAFAYLGIQLDEVKTAGKALTINFEVEGTGERYALVLKNRVLNHSVKQAASPDLTVKGTREASVLALMNGKPNEAIAQGAVKVEGRPAALSELLELTTRPKFWFPIVTRPKWER